MSIQVLYDFLADTDVFVQRICNTSIRTIFNYCDNILIIKINTATKYSTGVVDSFSTLDRHVSIHTTEFVQIAETDVEELFKNRGFL